MKAKNELKKEGIEVIKKLDTLQINSIAKSISKKLCNTFPTYNLNYNTLFIMISRLNMYIAKMPRNSDKAKYFLKDSSIYFNETIGMENIDSFAMHECIHFLQDMKNINNKLTRLGLSIFTEFRTYGTAMNEAGVQLLTSKALNFPVEIEKYYDITLNTTSAYYPLQCSLLNQMSYFTGEECLIDSILNSSETFINTFSELCGEKVYYTIQENLDKILYLEEKLLNLNDNLQNSNNSINNIKNLNKKIEKNRNEITTIFIKTQNLILTSFFNKAFNNIKTEQDIEHYRNRLYCFRNLIGTIDNYDFFDKFYVDKMVKLEDKYNTIEKANSTSLTIIRTNKILAFFQKLKSQFQKDPNN